MKNIGKIKRLPFLIFDQVQVYSFDGTKLRKKYPDLIGGSHHRVDKIVPKKQIWIERMKTRKEERFLLAHEMIEYLLMKHLRFTYDKAHGIATGYEQALRQGHPFSLVFGDVVDRWLPKCMEDGLYLDLTDAYQSY